MDKRSIAALASAVRRAARCLAAAVLLGGTCQAADTDRDLHRYWDTRCKDCHGDAGAFARRTLRVADGRLLFTGSLAECRRFESLHDEKVVDALRDKRRRDRPQARIYRIWGRSASASGF